MFSIVISMRSVIWFTTGILPTVAAIIVGYIILKISKTVPTAIEEQKSPVVSALQKRYQMTAKTRRR